MGKYPGPSGISNRSKTLKQIWQSCYKKKCNLIVPIFFCLFDNTFRVRKVGRLTQFLRLRVFLCKGKSNKYILRVLMEFSESEVYRFLLLYELCINYALEKKMRAPVCGSYE